MDEATTRAMATGPEHHVETEQKVTPLELFFDLVFVFAFTQVTGMMAVEASWASLGEGLLVLAAVWWAWAAYAWLTDEIGADDGLARVAVFGSMAAMLVAALAIPDAFGDDALLFGLAYLVVRVMHIVVYAAAADSVELTGAIKAIAPTAVGAPLLLILASAFDGGAQASIWLVALIIDYAGPQLRARSGWRVSPGHFAERFGLIMIIVLGESIVAIGVGLESVELGLGEVAAAVLGIAIVGGLWWSYFDVVAPVAEERLREAEGDERTRLAQDGYAYLHLLLIAGVVLLALGLKKTLGEVDVSLKTVPAVALCGGAALYLVGHVLFRARMLGTLNRERMLAAILCLALIPLATAVDALIAELALAAVLVGLVAYEAIVFSEARRQVRGERHA
ncbi:MAG TPA: low temperature requirement protein A [Solirubrobacterales bacterium]|nr:low temperature requirement protein A [Solirubrobacterales bacterium]